VQSGPDADIGVSPLFPHPAAPSPYVVPYAGHWSAPLMLAALAGIVHDRQSPDQHRHAEDDQYGGLHCDLATAGPTPTDLDSS
jgi:hypothetical protein